jgi:radical SAM superfamily enzyme
MVETVRYVVASGATGIKLQLLHVLRGTDLAKDYEAGKFEVLTEDAYMEILRQCLAVIPPQMVIHRLTGDGPKRILIAPLWSGDKKHVLNRVNRLLEERKEEE